MTGKIKQVANKFGTAPVFFTAISTILGAIMFLRFGFAVGQVGLLGTIAIIIIGHAVTIPTAMAIAEIATNQKVEGGGEYYIISRSFGLVIGTTIGIALFMSQAISVAFYVMAFSEAFTPFFSWLRSALSLPGWLEWVLMKKQTVGIPALILLTWVMLSKGANLGVKLLYIVVATLALSLIAFFLGTTEYEKKVDLDPVRSVHSKYTGSEITGPETKVWVDSAESIVIEPVESLDEPPAEGSEDSKFPIEIIGFFAVFAIIFPAFTGMTAGVGLSGDLADPGKSIPLGTLSATVIGMVIYFFIAWKLASAAPPEQLADTTTLVMADIAWQGWWLIPLGLAAATISSALGSIMVAPRTLQAIARDKMFPSRWVNYWLSRGKGKTDEPYNASVITVIIGMFFVILGGLNVVAAVISMFFMVTYGSLCLISFLQHFAADPSYRPRFRSKWYISLFGAVACFGLMFFMNPGYAFLAIVLMIALYFYVAYINSDKNAISLIFQGVIFQISRQIHVFMLKSNKEQSGSWRPSAICLSERSFDRLGAFDLLRWISQRYGFGTYIHLIKGYLSRQSSMEAKEAKDRLIHMIEASRSNMYVDTLISPSYTSSIAQVIQLPGMAGAENNLILFEFAKSNPADLDDLIDNFKLIKAVNFDILMLASSDKGFGLKREIHVWIGAKDYENANLMILLAYIISGHRDWYKAQITIFAMFPEADVHAERARLSMLIQAGQLPISEHNLKVKVQRQDVETRSVITETSRDADLVILGFREESVKRKGREVFLGYDGLANVLFVNAAAEKNIK
jgi:amino acid transporter